MRNLALIAELVISCGVLSLLSLIILHFVSPEYKLSWSMVSEYALGKHKWLLTIFFVFWGFSSILASYLYFSLIPNMWGVIGALFVFVSGIGAILGGIFDVKHKLHGLSFAIGVPTLPIGALIIAYQLGNQNNWLDHKNQLLLSAHRVWISLVLMGITMVIFFSGLKKAGVPFGPDQEPIKEIPENVIALNGYANRLLVLVYVAFNIIVSLIFLNL